EAASRLQAAVARHATALEDRLDLLLVLHRLGAVLEFNDLHGPDFVFFLCPHDHGNHPDQAEGKQIAHLKDLLESRSWTPKARRLAFGLGLFSREQAASLPFAPHISG